MKTERGWLIVGHLAILLILDLAFGRGFVSFVEIAIFLMVADKFFPGGDS